MTSLSRREFLAASATVTLAAAVGAGCASETGTGSATTTPAATIPATTIPATTIPATTIPATIGPATTSPTTTVPVTTNTVPMGSLNDIDHVVIFFQENRSFDHYFGTRQGVRGFGDTSVLMNSGNRPIWYQNDPTNPDGYLLPYRLNTATTSGACGPDPGHYWEQQHAAWNGGKLDGFATATGSAAMGYFTSTDLPFYSALADQFTLCDQYFCSVLGPTTPNRLYTMSATIDPGGSGGGPVTTNAVGPFTWATYPERLQQAGISWRIYHEADDFDDNPLKFFSAFQNLPESDPLFDAAMRNRAADEFVNDARNGNLPQVSWIVAPTVKSEHPPFPPAVGEDVTSTILAALMSNAQLWAKTLFILSYDENGGFFDHVPPPIPAPGTAGEYVGDEPIGLGFRVPAIIVSPWSKGGRVNSEVFDHTSTLRLLEQRFGAVRLTNRLAIQEKRHAGEANFQDTLGHADDCRSAVSHGAGGSGRRSRAGACPGAGHRCGAGAALCA